MELLKDKFTHSMDAFIGIVIPVILVAVMETERLLGIFLKTWMSDAQLGQTVEEQALDMALATLVILEIIINTPHMAAGSFFTHGVIIGIL